jgi:hypothetical protein
MRGRIESVVDSKVEQLRSNHGLRVKDSQSIVEITVVCNKCGGQYHVDELLDDGECDCFRDAD